MSTQEKKFPIYKLNATWSEDGEHEEKHINYHKGLPEGRTWNMISSVGKMFKEEQHQRDLDLYAMNWWKKYKRKHLKGKNAVIARLSMEYVEHEVWLLTWFQHETFDLGQTDKDILDSFESFIDRKKDVNMKNGHSPAEQDFNSKSPFYCFMGAEDRYRWKGTNDGTANTETPPPCRCKHCKKQGMIRIGH